MTTVATTPATPSEAEVLAREMAAAFGRMVRDYQKYFKLPYKDALHQAQHLSAGLTNRDWPGEVR